MKLRSIVPMLWVTDVAASVRFYCEHLGFSCSNQLDYWAVLERDGVEIMFSLPNVHTPFERSMFTGSLYFQCDQVDELWQRLKDNVTVVYPIEDFEYGMREFAIRDNNGYLLQFGMKLES
jgi:uncharacterized glyoxalase superfamily protein PhnB